MWLGVSLRRDFWYWKLSQAPSHYFAMNVTANPNDHLRALIQENYAPAQDLRDADFSATTLELYERFLISFPGLNFKLDDVHNLMVQLGYKMVDRAEMEFAWVVRSK